MELKPFCDFSKNIRMHATIVGVLFTLVSTVLLVGSLWLYMLEDIPPQDAWIISFIMKFLLVAGILESFVTALYWIGFLERVQWCLAVVFGLLAVSVMLQCFGLFGAVLQADFKRACAILSGLAFFGYSLQVTWQLYKTNSENPVSQQRDRV